MYFVYFEWLIRIFDLIWFDYYDLSMLKSQYDIDYDY
jgi:hypothetical protein